MMTIRMYLFRWYLATGTIFLASHSISKVVSQLFSKMNWSVTFCSAHILDNKAANSCLIKFRNILNIINRFS